MEGDTQEGAAKAKEDEANQTAVGCFALIVLVIVGGLLFKGCSMMAEHGKKLKAEDKQEKVVTQAEEEPSDTVVNAAARQAVLFKLTDPDSAKFRNVFVVAKPGQAKAVCGEVNAKNQMGGYTGYRRFISAGTAKLTYFEQDLADMNEAWRTLCTR